MRIGSLVQCTHEFDDIGFERTPIIGKIYTVREIIGGRWKYIKLSEVVNPKVHYDGAFGEAEFDMRGFKEVVPPIENVEQHIKENALQCDLVNQ